MPPDPLWINASAGAPSYSANELRQAMALGLMYGGRNMGAWQGVRPGGDQLKVSYSAPTITVQPGVGCIDPGLTTTQGPYWVAIPVAETHTLTAADATNPRKDIVVLRVYDHDEDASGLRLARTEYLVGTPAPSPAEPATPAGSTKLALIDVPASPGAPVVTDTRRFTVAAGGILPVFTAGVITAGTEGRYRDRLDTNVLERDSGSVWETVADPSIFKPSIAWTPVWTATSTNPELGNGTLAGRYIQIGKLVHWWLTLLPGSTTTFGSGTWQFSLPVARSGAIRHDGSGFALDLSPTVIYYPATVRYTGSVTNLITSGGSGSLMSAGSPHTWASGDELSAGGVYEAT